MILLFFINTDNEFVSVTQVLVHIYGTSELDIIRPLLKVVW
jgi:hypothetical protein